MKNRRYGIVLTLFVFVFLCAFGSANAEKSLAEIYKTGKVRFIPEITIDDSSLPEDAFFLGYGDIVVDDSGNVYVLDSKAKHIKKFDAGGNFLKLIGREGQGPGEFTRPSKLICSSDKLVAWDMMGFRFSLFTMDGTPIKSVRHSFIEEGTPRNWRPLPSGEFVVGIEKIHRDPETPQDFSVVLFSPEMEQIKTIYTHPVWRNIWGIPNAPNIPLPFHPYVHWDVTPDGKIVIGFSDRYEIDIYDKDAVKLYSIHHAYDAVKVTKDDREMFLKGLVFSSQTGSGTIVKKDPPPVLKEYMRFPEFKPAFSGIAVDSEGNILVSPYGKDKKEEYKYFDAFYPNGNFIARVRVESEHTFLSFRGAQIINGCFWVREYDKDGYQKIIKYRISE